MLLYDFHPPPVHTSLRPLSPARPATPESERSPLIATGAAMSTHARVPSDPPAPLFVRARVFAHARTARRVHGSVTSFLSVSCPLCCSLTRNTRSQLLPKHTTTSPPRPSIITKTSAQPNWRRKPAQRATAPQTPVKKRHAAKTAADIRNPRWFGTARRGDFTRMEPTTGTRPSPVSAGARVVLRVLYACRSRATGALDPGGGRPTPPGI